MENLRDFTSEELKGLMARLGEKPFRAGQVYRWVFGRGATDIDAMTDVALALRARLKERFRIEGLEVDRIRNSVDGTARFCCLLADGAAIESVIMPEGSRTTLCVSSQAGCALGCRFCMTGKVGFERNLTLAELAGQVFAARDIIAAGGVDGPGGGEITNVVLMGMGEPLENYDNVLRFLTVLTDARGMGFSHNKVTLSTAGVVPGIKRLGHDTDVNLAVSLNATTDAVRSKLMPVNRRYPIGTLLAALRDYPLKGRRRITIEYVLIKGVNDSDADASRLVKLLGGLRCKVNLIPFNAFPGSGFERPPAERVNRFHDIVMRSGRMVITRLSKGADIEAACGQLRGAAARTG